MQNICRNFRQCKLGDTLTKLLRNKIRGNFDVSDKYSSRGPLPWEGKEKFAGKPQKAFKKCDIESNPTIEKNCDQPVLRSPKRNAYEWVVSDEKPCKPFKLKAAVEKTICEMRKFRKCLQACGDPALCQNLAPDCSIIKKTYPLMEAIEKGSIPGCARPVKSDKTRE